MSVCLIIQKQNEIYIGTDTAICSLIDGEYIRTGEYEDKFFIKNNIGYYCSGKLEITNKIKDYINSNSNVNDIINYIKLLDDKYLFNELDVELMIVSIDKCTHISKYNNFNAVEYKIKNIDDIYLLSIGFKASDNWHKSYDNLINKKQSEIDSIKNTIISSSCQEIGGKYKIYHLNNEGFKLLAYDKVDDITFQNTKNNQFLLNAEVIMGALIASNSLLITNSNGKFVVDSNGATLTDASLEILGNNGLNRILLDPDNGFKIQKSTESGWVDVAYLDNEGNAIFEANLDVESININQKFIVDTLGNVTMNGTLDIGDGKLTFTGGTLTVEGDIVANDLFLYIDGVKTSIIDEITGKIDGQYITGGMSGTTALGNLLVDNLSTSDKIRNYLASDTSQVNYIRIYDQYIEFVEATYSGGTTQARTGDKTGDLLYWTDDTHNFVTIENTGKPVMVYNYTELIKGKYGYNSSNGVNVPTIELGTGTGNTRDSGKAYIYKEVDGFYIEYKHSVTGQSSFIKITDDGIDLSMFPKIIQPQEIEGVPKLWVQSEVPTEAQIDDAWIDVDDYTRYDKKVVTENTVLVIADYEMIRASGTITITLHEATTAGIIKKIKNVGNGVITLVGTIDNKTNMNLFPMESVELITNGTSWDIE